MSEPLSVTTEPPEYILQKREAVPVSNLSNYMDSSWSLREIPSCDFSEVPPPVLDGSSVESPKPLYDITEIENVFIHMPDGVKLAARIWLPKADYSQSKFAAILEFLPYGKRHGTAHRDEINYNFITKFGFACLRVDIRGTGESEGICTDEYTEQEHNDAIAVIKWAAGQPWCSGKVGMTGISWGGFNALQVAAKRPVELKGILALCCSDNRYNVDVHYSGGCLLLDNISWGAFMLTLLGCAPDPVISGSNWKDIWLQRLNAVEPWIHKWLKHQKYDKYWKYGSICEEYSSVDCPVLLASGWADGYCDSVPNLLENLKLPTNMIMRGINGPWAHNYPHMASPGPSVDWLSESVKWWLYCLQNDTSMEKEWRSRPAYSAFMEEREEPDILVEKRNGRWVTESKWPPTCDQKHFYIGHDKKLHIEKSTVKSRAYRNFSSPLSTGLDCGRLGYGKDPDFPVDQRHEDANSICFDSDILQERLEILAAPVVNLSLTSTSDIASLVVRVCDVDPRTGSSALVSYGVLNLTHRNSHENPEPLIPGKLYENIMVKCGDIGHAFPAGNKIRLAISTSMWPYIWPAPKPFKLSIQTITKDSVYSQLLLPVRPLPSTFEEASSNQPKISSFYRDPKKGESSVLSELRPAKLGTRHLWTDYVTGQKCLTLTKDYGCSRDESHGMEHDEFTEEIYTIRDPKHARFGVDPLSAKVQVKYVIEAARSKDWMKKLSEQGRNALRDDEATDWRTRTESLTKVESTETHFIITSELKAFETVEGNQKLIFSRSWSEKIPRVLM